MQLTEQKGRNSAKRHGLSRATSNDEDQSDTKRQVARSVFGRCVGTELGARRERPNWGLA